MELIKKHPVISLIIISLMAGGALSLISNLGRLIEGRGNIIPLFWEGVFAAPFVGAVIILPIMLLALEVIGLICESKGNQMRGIRIFDLMSLALGSLYEVMFLAVVKNIEGADWEEQLSNAAKHTPIYTKAGVTVFSIFLISIIGYLVLQYVHIENMAPLVVVLSISAMYLGIIQLIVLTIQVFELKPGSSDLVDFFLLILPACCILMAARTILKKIHEWNTMKMEMGKIEEEPILTLSEKILENANLWPALAVLLMFPLLGIIIMILVLFGQAPDSIVKAWTETSDWTLSQRQAPLNLYYDEHYLCTVAAGGHRRIVKPIRKGVRHGHEVIVNRQLCIANAFEEVIQEKTPRFHRVVRSFYDRFGFPVAKLIRKKWQADVVYIIMKPLEWTFLAVFYLSDVHPENRIAVQYMGKVPEYRH